MFNTGLRTKGLSLIENVPKVLTSEERLEVYRGLQYLRPMWIQNRKDGPWFTLGAAAYLDALDGPRDYLERADFFNKIMMEVFGWLYEKYLSHIKKIAGTEKVYFHPYFALPGFHIFQYRPELLLRDDLQMQIHRDQQYKLLDFSGPITKHLSATLCVLLPKEGGGLNYWTSKLDQEPKTTPEFYKYTEGSISYHFGDLWHQIAPPKNPTIFCERITFQGQAAFREVDESWIIYR